MKCIKGDILWSTILLVCVVILVVPSSREAFVDVTGAHPYWGGFIKFFILATMGDLLGARIINNKWIIPQGFIRKATVWGVLGIIITLVFSVYVIGTQAAQHTGKLPFEGSIIALAFFSSVIMNITFGPMLYIYHKFGDLLIDMSIEKKKGIYTGKITTAELVSRVDWYAMVGFSWLKTCLFIWIPAHTLVFLMQEQYRVLASAFLSILLGIIVAITKKSKAETTLAKQLV